MKSNPPRLEPKADKDTVRRHNLSLVLRAVHDGGEATRAGVAARVGLTRAAVSSLVEQLMESGFVTESGKTFSGQAGRPGTVLKVARTGVAGLGVEVNVDYVSVCVTDLSGDARVRLTEHTDNRAAPSAEVLARAAAIASRALESAAEVGLRPVGVQLALPGLVSGGTVRQAPNLGWNGVAAQDVFARALAGLLPERPALPVGSDNEANLAALAELWFGGLGRERTFLYLSGEIGVGGALVLGGELLRGAHGFAGEIGHVVVDPEGPACRCGSRGCLEQYAGQRAVLRAAGIDENAGLPGVVELEARARADDALAVAAIRQAGSMLGLVLSGAVNLFDPDAVVLGGIYRTLMPWLSPPAVEELNHRVVSGLWPGAGGRLRAASLTGDAARGAAALVVRDVLADPAAY
ncbi:transcriptional regulator [Streptomyces agglomeratus]|uniref:Transcriptional regulator n=1 Tax=Streptomyces agglomeratus TaxID=285458 RepID=A0A1E5P3N0_9ACTN|nr:ROK family transcriptional regulator [Streptomyces agglomeratus]OEJ24135.1 transcriptional regulator [Streptomyces agglomeratus]OEJ41861.1 transcriptional regulator [Streptomyces agglomeratus]OEJ43761.1 transcriptional regulator [Streptomyces agglomeratus]OEJ54353.1 transcriptional regulator [Streptomyces agglomeratus]OEJ56236.1 transcriptional regulator [Streptomyces agglomeratus]